VTINYDLEDGTARGRLHPRLIAESGRSVRS
jgi:hypothetical protein